jgi:hypothetical protein
MGACPNRMLLAAALVLARTSIASSTPDTTNTSGTTLLPTDPRITYTGRVDRTNPALAQLAWVMTGAACTFEATRPGATVSAYFVSPKDGARLRVMIDGVFFAFCDVAPEPDQDGQGAPTPVLYGLGSVRTSGNHTLEFFKVTEDNTQKKSKGVLGFGGFAILIGGTFGPAPPTATRRLEFIGDSDTAGWCADGHPGGGDKPDTVQDGFETWAMQLARNCSAEVMVEAVSGYGVMPATPAIQSVLDFTLGFDTDGPKWNHSAWVPDAVVILIGPNDEMRTRPGQHARARRGGSHFVEDYLQLLTQVAKGYAGVPVPPKIVHVCGGSLNGLDPCSDIQKANERFNKLGLGMTGYYTTIDPGDPKTPHWSAINGCRPGTTDHCKGMSKYNGCDGHYNSVGHGVLAGDIIPQFKHIMGW